MTQVDFFNVYNSLIEISYINLNIKIDVGIFFFFY